MSASTSYSGHLNSTDSALVMHFKCDLNLIKGGYFCLLSGGKSMKDTEGSKAFVLETSSGPSRLALKCVRLRLKVQGNGHEFMLMRTGAGGVSQW